MPRGDFIKEYWTYKKSGGSMTKREYADSKKVKNNVSSNESAGTDQPVEKTD